MRKYNPVTVFKKIIEKTLCETVLQKKILLVLLAQVRLKNLQIPSLNH